MVLLKTTREQENLNLFVVMEVKVKPLSRMIKKMVPPLLEQIRSQNIRKSFQMVLNMVPIPNGSETETKKRKGHTTKEKNKVGLISTTAMERNYIFKHTKMVN